MILFLKMQIMIALSRTALACVFIAIIALNKESFAQQVQNQTNYSSKVPKYTFSNSLEEQEGQLKKNPLMLRFLASRKKLAADKFRPIYHFVSPESTLNDPNGLCFWKGYWHMFYQHNPFSNVWEHMHGRMQ